MVSVESTNRSLIQIFKSALGDQEYVEPGFYQITPEERWEKAKDRLFKRKAEVGSLITKTGEGGPRRLPELRAGVLGRAPSASAWDRGPVRPLEAKRVIAVKRTTAAGRQGASAKGCVRS